MPEDIFKKLYIEYPSRFRIKKNRGNEGVESAFFSKSEAKMTLGKWNDEVLMSVAYKKINGVGKRKALTDKIEWQGVNEKVIAYPLPATPEMDGGGYELEIELAKKPTSNIFEFEIKGAGELDFFYQAELTQKEKDDGAERPDNVIGSYAVYHKTKKDYSKGKLNYKTGKAYHIYRPKAIDADNNEVWGELDYKNGVLSVTVPQTFLDTAVYPVKVDPTFGYTTAGGSNSSNLNLITGSEFTIPEAGTADSLSWYGRIYHIVSSGTKAKMAIYKHSDLSFIEATAERSNDPLLGYGWKTWDLLSNPSLISSTDYVLVVWHGGVSVSFQVQYDSGSTDQGHRDSQTYNGWPDPLVPTHNNNKYSIYCTYTAAPLPAGRSFGQIL